MTHLYKSIITVALVGFIFLGSILPALAQETDMTQRRGFFSFLRERQVESRMLFRKNVFSTLDIVEGNTEQDIILEVPATQTTDPQVQ